MLGLILKTRKIKTHKLFSSYIILALILLSLPTVLSGQRIMPAFGRGIQFVAPDSSFSLNLSGRIQSMAEVKVNPNIKEADADFFVRRCRLNIQGDALKIGFSYRIQIGFSQRDISSDNSVVTSNLILRDAMLFYSPSKWLKLGIGQTKLPGNRQRMISSANLQLVERSIVNNNFTLDRDKGIWIFTNFPIGKTHTRFNFAVSSGEGRINSDRNGELCYSGRAEFLPLGLFTHNNDYLESSINREQSPKLSLGMAASYNSMAARTHGQLGEYFQSNSHTNISYYGADLLFKYRRVSLELEAYNRTGSQSVFYNSSDSSKVNFLMSGTGLMLQSGLILGNRSEIACRIASIISDPSIKQLHKGQSEYVLGYSRYVFTHKLKVQSDLSLLDNKSTNRKQYIYRLSCVMTF